MKGRLAPFCILLILSLPSPLNGQVLCDAQNPTMFAKTLDKYVPLYVEWSGLIGKLRRRGLDMPEPYHTKCRIARPDPTVFDPTVLLFMNPSHICCLHIIS